MSVILYPQCPKSHAKAKALADAGRIRILHDRERNVFVAVPLNARKVQ